MMVGFQVLEHKINIKDPPPFPPLSELLPLNTEIGTTVITANMKNRAIKS